LVRKAKTRLLRRPVTVPLVGRFDAAITALGERLEKALRDGA